MNGPTGSATGKDLDMTNPTSSDYAALVLRLALKLLARNVAK